MKAIPLERVCAVCGAVSNGPLPAGAVTAVVTDSRAVTPGCLFAAIPGERVDGHSFISAALAQGAAAALSEREVEAAPGRVLRVENTVAALQALAGDYRAGFDLPLVGVTGSVGKTTAKEMLACVLSRRFRVHKTAGNFNNDLGVPLTLFGLEADHTAAVVELGVSHPGDMDRIAAIARPTVALYTNIGDAHLEYLGSREGVLAEKSRMNAYLPADGLVVCNGDDPLLAAMDCAHPKLTYGLGYYCDVRAEDVRSDGEGQTRCTVVTEHTRFPIVIPAFGEHMVYAALGAAAVGMALGLSPSEIAAGVVDYVPVGHRARLLKTGLLTVIDDCYNANPTSTASALRSLAAMPGRRVAILGDMRELGEQSAALHRETGALAAALGIDLVLTCGEEAKHIAEGAGDAARHYLRKEGLLGALPYLLREGDAVLVKASRGARFEEVTEVLEHLVLSEPEFWDLYDAEGKPTGRVHPRGEPVPEGCFHPVVHVWLRGPDGRFLISRRAESRPTYPLLYECVGGSILAGETWAEGAVREVYEELGVVLDPAKGRRLARKVRPEYRDIGEAWVFDYDGPVDLSRAPTDEVCSAAWMTMDQIRALYDRGELVPTLEYCFKLL